MYNVDQFKIEDLKQENFELRKQINELKNVLYLNKVRIRKLETENRKKEKEISVLMDPKNSRSFHKLLWDNGASFVMLLKKENEQLNRLLFEKDIIIKRLNAEIKAKNIYSRFSKNKRNLEIDLREKSLVADEYESKVPDLETNRSNSELLDKEPLNYFKLGQPLTNHMIMSLQLNDLKKLHSNLSKIKEKSRSDEKANHFENKNFNAKPWSTAVTDAVTIDSSLSSDVDFSCDTPHEEIQKLQNYFVEMCTEVDDLKLVINTLRKKKSTLPSDELQPTQSTTSLNTSPHSVPKKKLKCKRKKIGPKRVFSKCKTWNTRFGEESLSTYSKSDMKISMSSSFSFNTYNEYIEIPQNIDTLSIR